jgi:S1-C subfamily serine protease
MRLYRLGLAGSVLLSLLFSPPVPGATVPALDLTTLARRARPSVALIVVYDRRGNEVCTGTGFVVSADGRLLTNHHVMAEGVSASVRFENGTVLPVQRILAEDERNDISVIQVRARDLRPLPLGDTGSMEPGERVAVIGSPLGLEGTLTEGIVSAIREISGWKRCLQISAPISSGSSGSPVLNAAGEVVGIATFLLKEGQALNFAVPAEYAARLVGEDVLARVPRPDRAAEAGAPSAETGTQSPAAPPAPASGVQPGNAVAPVAKEIVGSPQYLSLVVAVRGGTPEEILGAARDVVRLEPSCSFAHMQMGIAYHDMGEEHAAAAACEDALRADPSNAAGWRLLGTLRVALGNRDGAIESWKHALQIAPRDSVTWRFLASEYSRSDEAGTRAAIISLARTWPDCAGRYAPILTGNTGSADSTASNRPGGRE